ncbi:MAG: phosphoribosylanthranilate isomerase [Gammaproteobacteria bacterium]|nr:phosphoribosylanthranilate isomerase [Gammaproteobacteria bacterium]NND38043.1 phosphoribosylanthranilate isomerase [Pseudomonadales bacterium]MBT8152044.1 phosphoribosylanthranilate isomerase [Gammaproteobacteria bacterium]NNL11479.1 phosphoribosylanthranilate isomerase [Pseudomonadales bacterium]NNM10640.1 phosphoribosylanthranilate isomerase [Pseudomonadales bacterium]
MFRTRIKICGLTRREDVQVAVRAGADALGLVFYAKSPRAVSLEQAAGLMRELPPMVASVALFVDAQPGEIEAVVQTLGPSLLQFHGAERASFCEQFGVPYMKALHLPQPGASASAREQAMAALASQMAEHANAAAFLLDTQSDKGRGGTGERFDSALWPAQSERPLVMAGGLDASNVGRAIAACQPYAVDVSSGVESAPGLKCAAQIEKFVAAVKDA